MALTGVLRPGHVALRVLELEPALKHYRDVLGLIEVARDDKGRVFLKAWDEHDHHSVVLREADEAGMDYMGWKVDSPATLKKLAADVEQSGLEPQVFRRFQGSRPGTRRLLGLIPIGVGGIADRLQRKAPTVHIPVVCGDRAAGSGDSHEFSNALLRISQKEQHQSHDRSIHAGVRQGQRLGVALEEANPHRRDALARKRQLFWGWIDTHHCRWPLPPEQGLGEGAIAATIIQPSQPWGQRQPVQERIGHQRAPSPHHQLVRGWIVEDELRGERHVCPGDRHGRLQTGKVGSALIARTSVFPTPIAKWTNSKPFSTSLRLRKPAVCRQRRASGA